ncbi:MAG: kynureninase [Bdellovibrionaceae bacterium]|nr:kynureninase [Pseudobdellovibrionaceae bacterium]
MMKTAQQLDTADELLMYREEFLYPMQPNGEPYIYLCGNSLGLQPRNAKKYIMEELEDWEKFGVEGHFEARHPWLPYHEFVAEPLARLVGGKPDEVVAMNSLTVNLHLLMASFYRPTKKRYKIVIEGHAFPSDQYAVASQARFHGQHLGDLADPILEIFPSEGRSYVRTEDFVQFLEQHKDEVALVLIGGVNYLNGQFFDLPEICKKTHDIGAVFGVDLAHAAGNVVLKLHDWQVDFASWCSYKYLNSGPGGISGIFVHEKHHGLTEIPRFEGWWGHNKSTRFKMPSEFVPIDTAEAWQLSNPPIFQLAALRASLEIFDRATMPRLRKKSEQLTTFLWEHLQTLPKGFATIFTPEDVARRGSQLSLKIKDANREMVGALRHDGIICDFREPDIIRVAPAPLYNSFTDCALFVEGLKKYANG